MSSAQGKQGERARAQTDHRGHVHGELERGLLLVDAERDGLRLGSRFGSRGQHGSVVGDGSGREQPAEVIVAVGHEREGNRDGLEHVEKPLQNRRRVRKRERE